MKTSLAIVAAAVAAGALLLIRPPLAGIGAHAGTPVSPAAAGGWTPVTPPPRAGARPTAPATAVVYVAGAVFRPGVYNVPGDARVRDAVARGGGLRPDADPVAVNLAAHVRDGDEIVVAVRGAAAPAHGRPSRRASQRGDGSDRQAVAVQPKHSRRGRGPRHGAAPASGLIDLNTADADMLATVPGIGPGLAIRIVAFRASNGPFASPDELLDVAGITDRRLDAILPYVVAR